MHEIGCHDSDTHEEVNKACCRYMGLICSIKSLDMQDIPQHRTERKFQVIVFIWSMDTASAVTLSMKWFL